MIRTERSSALGWPAVVSIMLGIFSIVATEILPIGMLTKIGASFTISDGMSGLMMTMPGLLAAVAAPVVTVTTARIDRRRMLCTFMLLLAAANFLAAAYVHLERAAAGRAQLLTEVTAFLGEPS